MELDAPSRRRIQGIRFLFRVLIAILPLRFRMSGWGRPSLRPGGLAAGSLVLRLAWVPDLAFGVRACGGRRNVPGAEGRDLWGRPAGERKGDGLCSVHRWSCGNHGPVRFDPGRPARCASLAAAGFCLDSGGALHGLISTPRFKAASRFRPSVSGRSLPYA